MSKNTTAGETELARILERLQAIEERLARLEGESQAAGAIAADFVPLAPPAPDPMEAPGSPGMAEAVTRPAQVISEDVLLVISAAVAAFLGERAHVRQVRLLHSDAWAQQGRVSVMASHRWAVHR